MNMARVSFFLANAIAFPYLSTCDILSSTSFATSPMSTFLFEGNANKRFTNVTATFSKDSLIQCGYLCANDERCDVFNFQQANNICQLCPFYPGNNDLVAEENGWKMFYGADDCKSSPCLNSGTCTDTIGSYACECAVGYGGPNCEIGSTCLPGWVKFDRSCYFFDETRQLLDQARNNCSGRVSTAHLVYIKSEQVQTFLANLLGHVNSGEGTWLGAYVHGTTFYWDDDTEFSYSKWGPNEPAGDGSQPTVAAWKGYNWLWADVLSTYRESSVCEYEIP